MDVHKRIEELRLKRGWSRSKLAKESGLSETTVYDWFNENHFTPSRRAIEDVCAAFGITLAQFYSDINFDGLSEMQMRLLEFFDKVPERKKSIVIDVVKSFTES